MITILILILISQIVANSWIIYLLFKLLPKENQKEILRTVMKPKAKVMEWKPKEEDEKVAEEKVMEDLKL